MTQETTPDMNSQPQQEEMPFAVVQGTPVSEVPKDLYIPPDALEVFLAESFEGPLDLLLYLIKRQNLNILDIPIADITHQYMEYVELMKEIRLELAAEYLVMAAMLDPRTRLQEADCLVRILALLFRLPICLTISRHQNCPYTRCEITPFLVSNSNMSIIK